jgi:hypothetical protein
MALWPWLWRALVCALQLGLALGTGVLPRSPMTKGLKVYMMILSVDGMYVPRFSSLKK